MQIVFKAEIVEAADEFVTGANYPVQDVAEGVLVVSAAIQNGASRPKLNTHMRTPGVPPAPIPPEILLPDGRSYRVVDLYRQVTRPQRHNLLTGTVTRTRTDPAVYTDEERVFMATEPIAAIQERFGATREQAKRMRYNSRSKLGIPTRGLPELDTPDNTHL